MLASGACESSTDEKEARFNIVKGMWVLFGSFFMFSNFYGLDLHNEPLGARGSPLVGEEVRNKDVGKVGS